MTTYADVDAAVNVVVPPAAATLVKPSKSEFAVTLEFESRKTTLLAPVDAVTPVPPLATANVPATVIAPVVGEDGVSPVVPNVMDETPAEDGMVEDHEGAPLVVATSTCPVVPAPVMPIAVVDAP